MFHVTKLVNVPGCGEAVTKEKFAEHNLFATDEDLAAIPYVTDDNKFEIVSENKFLAHVKNSNYLKGNRSVNVISGKVNEKLKKGWEKRESEAGTIDYLETKTGKFQTEKPTNGDFIKNMQGAKIKAENLLKVFSPPIGPVGVVGVRDFPNFRTNAPQKLHWSGTFWNGLRGLVETQFADIIKKQCGDKF